MATAAVIALTAAVNGAMSQPANQRDAKADARCSKLYALVWRYEISPVAMSNTGTRLRADVAKADCERSNYQRGIPELERILRRGYIEIPQE